MPRTLLPLALVALLGCGNSDAPPPGHTPPEGSAGGPGLSQTGPAPEAAPGEVEVPGDAQFTQEALAAEGGVKLTGEFKCEEGRGPFVVQVFPPPPDQGGEETKDGPVGPLVKLPVASTGPFTLLAPKGRSGVVVGFEDGDGNGAMTPGEPLFFAGGGGPQVTQFTADRTGLVIDCAAVLSGPGQGGGQPPSGEGAGSGGPGAGPGGPGAGPGGAPPPGELGGEPPKGKAPPKGG